MSFVRSATDREKRTIFPRNWILLLSTPLLRHNRYNDIVKFQIDLVILFRRISLTDYLTSNAFFSFSRDFVLPFSGLFFFQFVHKATGNFLESSSRK